jgi:hypothetical protein
MRTIRPSSSRRITKPDTPRNRILASMAEP